MNFGEQAENDILENRTKVGRRDTFLRPYTIQMRQNQKNSLEIFREVLVK
ncbi:hypothetical protein SAMN05444388_11928 [Flavobacterium johnsoniae]|uniref:Uncharacterized protein n=1 Tax=Flavobacterium johnsoniae TaxID=986 RepID=A0A1M5VRR5_FLAJO|nr:hypothetical protein SAMN05444388_11928 [Flavobacterium johnsoniae]